MLPRERLVAAWLAADIRHHDPLLLALICYIAVLIALVIAIVVLTEVDFETACGSPLSAVSTFPSKEE